MCYKSFSVTLYMLKIVFKNKLKYREWMSRKLDLWSTEEGLKSKRTGQVRSQGEERTELGTKKMVVPHQADH